MHVSRSSLSNAQAHGAGRGRPKRTVAPSHDDRMGQFLNSIQACRGALSRELTADDYDLACNYSIVNKSSQASSFTAGTPHWERLSTRYSLAGEPKKAAIAQAAAIAAFLAAGLSMGMISIGGAIATEIRSACRQLCGKPRGKRSPGGVREDAMLRSLHTFGESVREARAAHAGAAVEGTLGVWRTKFAQGCQAFDALRASVMTHPSVRLRGSPELALELYSIAKDLARLDPSRPTPPAVVGGRSLADLRPKFIFE